MQKKELIIEFDNLIKAHYSEEIDSRDEWLREIVNLKHKVITELNIIDISEYKKLLSDCVHFIVDLDQDKLDTYDSQIDEFIKYQNCK